MPISNLKSKLSVGRDRYVCVSKALLKDFDGYYRKTLIGCDNSITLEYYATTDIEEDGPFRVCYYYRGECEMFSAAASFLGLSVDQLIESDDSIQFAPHKKRDSSRFLSDLKSHSLPEPSDWVERRILSLIL